MAPLTCTKTTIDTLSFYKGYYCSDTDNESGLSETKETFISPKADGHKTREECHLAVVILTH